ncbi:MAG: HAD family phosphatase [Planctomycetaceae bacterium]|nr:HAD family phosphatase [Planctomycetaceae bacterium]
MAKITTLFTDIGGVLGTNGWDTAARRRAAEKFEFDCDESNRRHSLTFDTFEVGKLSFDEYLKRTIFYQPRSFSLDEFKQFIFEQSQPFAETIELLKQIRRRHNVKIAVVSNEGRELNEYRVVKFGLKEFVDFFIVSSLVHFRKPDVDIFRLALDVAQVKPDEVVYLEDRPMFVEVASGLGIHGIRHVDVHTTRAALSQLGLGVD